MTNPLHIALALGLAAAALYAFMTGGASPFMVQGTTRFWTAASVPGLKAKLASIKVVPHPSAERIWVVAPAGSGTNALTEAVGIQLKGNVVTTSTNLDGGPGSPLLASVTPAEFGVIDTGPEGSVIAIAVAPALG